MQGKKALAIALFICLTTCGGDKKNNKGDDPSAGADGSQSPMPSAETEGGNVDLNSTKKKVKLKDLGNIPEAMVVGAPGPNKTAMSAFLELERSKLIVPQQFSKFLQKAFGFQLKKSTSAWWGFESDYIIGRYLVELGGADYNRVYTKTQDITPQLLLNMRKVGFWYSLQGVKSSSEDKDKGNESSLFIYADPRYDRPFLESDKQYSKKYQATMKERDMNWHAQWNYIFKRFFNRSHTQKELEIIKEHFLKIYELEENWTWAAWIITMSHILTLEEVWNI